MYFKLYQVIYHITFYHILWVFYYIKSYHFMFCYIKSHCISDYFLYYILDQIII